MIDDFNEGSHTKPLPLKLCVLSSQLVPIKREEHVHRKPVEEMKYK